MLNLHFIFPKQIVVFEGLLTKNVGGRPKKRLSASKPKEG
jgi:hypothetical protein